MARHQPVKLILCVLALSILAIVGTAAAQPKAGGVLRVAITGDPPGLDPHAFNAAIAEEINSHMVEMLYAFDGDGVIQPMLAAALPEISDGGKTYTIALRQGVPFQDGSMLDAQDVVDSLERWRRMSDGKAILANLDRFETPDDHTVVIHLTQPSGILTSVLAFTQAKAVIYSSEQIAAVGDEPIDEPIGTGPYQFDKWIRGDRVVLKRFDGYAARDEAPSGDAGHKNAWLDEIDFISVPDAATRQAGLESGEYDVNYRAPGQELDRIDASDTMYGWPMRPGYAFSLLINRGSPVMQNVELRRALQATLDSFPIMLGAYGSEKLFDLNPGIIPPQYGAMYTDAGGDLYDQADPEAGKAHLDASGYDGTKIRWITTRDYDYMYKATLAAVDQMNEIGLNSDVIVRDWATTVQTFQKTEDWDILVVNLQTAPEPELINYLNPGWVNDFDPPSVDGLLEQIRGSADPAQRRALWEQAQAAFYDDVGTVKLANTFLLNAYSSKVHVEARYFLFQAWNTWKD